jgi:hypothetical protein
VVEGIIWDKHVVETEAVFEERWLVLVKDDVLSDEAPGKGRPGWHLREVTPYSAAKSITLRLRYFDLRHQTFKLLQICNQPKHLLE